MSVYTAARVGEREGDQNRWLSLSDPPFPLPAALAPHFCQSYL